MCLNSVKKKGSREQKIQDIQAKDTHELRLHVARSMPKGESQRWRPLRALPPLFPRAALCCQTANGG